MVLAGKGVFQILNLFEDLKSNAYPGRGIMLGLSAVILRVAWASQVAQVVKNLPAKQETGV